MGSGSMGSSSHHYYGAGTNRHNPWPMLSALVSSHVTESNSRSISSDRPDLGVVDEAEPVLADLRKWLCQAPPVQIPSATPHPSTLRFRNNHLAHDIWNER
ncbi:uncharacterized protein [Lolium perenne]|uniref:uncharacterized protein isoform X1 n=1 Tax=Lolium perenne TaxID=4522 RepID=UPI003A992C6C